MILKKVDVMVTAKCLCIFVAAYILVWVTRSVCGAFYTVTTTVAQTIESCTTMRLLCAFIDWEHLVVSIGQGNWFQAFIPRWLLSPSFPFSRLPSSSPIFNSPSPHVGLSALADLSMPRNAVDMSGLFGLSIFSFQRILAWAGLGRRWRLGAMACTWLIGAISVH